MKLVKNFKIWKFARLSGSVAEKLSKMSLPQARGNTLKNEVALLCQKRSWACFRLLFWGKVLESTKIRVAENSSNSKIVPLQNSSNSCFLWPQLTSKRHWTGIFHCYFGRKWFCFRIISVIWDFKWAKKVSKSSFFKLFWENPSWNIDNGTKSCYLMTEKLKNFAKFKEVEILDAKRQDFKLVNIFGTSKWALFSRLSLAQKCNEDFLQASKMEEVNPMSFEKYQFEHRVLSKVIAFFAVFALLGYRWKEINRFSSIEWSSSSNDLSIEPLMHKVKLVVLSNFELKNYRTLNGKLEIFRQGFEDCFLLFQRNISGRKFYEKVHHSVLRLSEKFSNFEEKLFARLSKLHSTCPKEHFGS